jgi:hypothetical protein
VNGIGREAVTLSLDSASLGLNESLSRLPHLLFEICLKQALREVDVKLGHVDIEGFGCINLRRFQPSFMLVEK